MTLEEKFALVAKTQDDPATAVRCALVRHGYGCTLEAAIQDDHIVLRGPSSHCSVVVPEKDLLVLR